MNNARTFVSPPDILLLIVGRFGLAFGFVGFRLEIWQPSQVFAEIISSI